MVHIDYQRHAANVDRAQGTPALEWGPVRTKLNQFGIRRVLGLVVGSYGEYSQDVYDLVELAAGQKAMKQAQYLKGEIRGALAMYRTRIYRSLSFIAHLGWARLKMSRIDLILRSNLPGYGGGDMMEEELSVLEEYAFNHPERPAVAGPCLLLYD